MRSWCWCYDNAAAGLFVFFFFYYLLEFGVTDLSVHDHGLKHGSISDDEFNHPMDQLDEVNVRGDHYTNHCIVQQLERGGGRREEGGAER